MEKPRRGDLMTQIGVEASIGPVENWLRPRGEWLIQNAKIQEYLASKIVYTDKLAGKVEKGVKVLALGAGKGHEMDELDAILPGSEIIGVDPHDYLSRPVKKRLDSLAHDSKYLEENVSAEELKGIEDQSLDGVTLFFVLHHLAEENYEQIFGELSRVLKDDAYVFIAEDIVNNQEEEEKAKKWIDF